MRSSTASLALLTVLVFSAGAAEPEAEPSGGVTPRTHSAGARGGDPPDLPVVGLHRRRLAFCVGINGYAESSGYQPLKWAGADAVAMSETLLGKCRFDEVFLVTDGPVPERLRDVSADRLTVQSETGAEQISKAAREFFLRSQHPDDVLVFYYAGHGDAKYGPPYLIPGDYLDQNSEVIQLARVFGWVQDHRVKGRNKALIFDACRSAVTSASGQVMVPDFSNALLNRKRQVVVISACGSQQSAKEDDELRHGRLTHALLEGLRGAAFKTDDENLLVTHLSEYVSKMFAERGWEDQTPQMIGKIDRPFSLAYRKRSLKPVDEATRSVIETMRASATRQYVRGELDVSNEQFKTCLTLVSALVAGQQDATKLQRVLQAEHARGLYRAGHPVEDAAPKTAALRTSADTPSEETSSDETELFIPALAELNGYRALARQAYAEAVIELKRAADGFPQDALAPHLLSQLATAHVYQEEFAEAVDAFERAAKRCISVEALDEAAMNFELAARCCKHVPDSKDRVIRLLYEALKLSRPEQNTPASPERVQLLHRLSSLSADAGQQRLALHAAIEALRVQGSERNMISLQEVEVLAHAAELAGYQGALAERVRNELVRLLGSDAEEVERLGFEIELAILKPQSSDADGELRDLKIELAGVLRETRETTAYALLVGVGDVPRRGAATLKGVPEETRTLAALLKERGFTETVLTDAKRGEARDRGTLPTRENILRELRRLSLAADRSDTVFVVFSGTAVSSRDGAALIPADATNDQRSLITVDQVTELLGESRSGNVMLSLNLYSDGSGPVASPDHPRLLKASDAVQGKRRFPVLVHLNQSGEDPPMKKASPFLTAMTAGVDFATADQDNDGAIDNFEFFSTVTQSLAKAGVDRPETPVVLVGWPPYRADLFCAPRAEFPPLEELMPAEGLARSDGDADLEGDLSTRMAALSEAAAKELLAAGGDVRVDVTVMYPIPDGSARVIQSALAEHLARRFVRVSDRAQHVLRVSVRLTKLNSDHGPTTALAFRGQLFDDDLGDVVATLTAPPLTDARSVAQLAGLNVDIDPRSRSSRDRLLEKVIRDDIKIEQGWVASTQKSPYGVSLLVRGEATEVHEVDSQAVAQLPPGTQYAVRLKNSSESPVAVDLRVDGLSVFHYLKDAKVEFMLVPAGETVTVRGWHLDIHRAKAFVVTPQRSVASANRATPGMVYATFHAAWKKGDPPPDGERPSVVGTGFGQEVQASVSNFGYEVGTIRAGVGIRYGLER